jgi:hypothetical protein
MGTSYEIEQLRRLRVAIETAGQLAVDQTGSPSNFKDVPFTEGSLNADRKQESTWPKTQKQTVDQHELEVLGRKTVSCAFTTALSGSGVVQDGTQTSTAQFPVASGTGVAWWLAMMMQTVMGGMRQEGTAKSAQTQVQAGSTTSLINVTATHGVRFTAGGFIACVVNGRVEMREVLSVATDAISVKVAFSGTPSNGSAVYTGPTFYYTQNPTSTLQLWDESAHDYKRFWYGGLQGGFTLDTKIGTDSVPMIGWQLDGPLWTKMSNSAMAAATYGNYSLAHDGDFEFIVATVGSTTRTQQPIAEAAFTASPKYQMITGGGATAVQSIIRQIRQRAVPFTLAFSSYWDNITDFYAGQSARTAYNFGLQIGSTTAGPCFLLTAPTAQVRLPKDKSVSNTEGMAVTAVLRNDSALGDNTGGLLDSPFRLHVMG